ncbi:hypothetical protein QMZ05_20585 [Bradyrhizobium sp. INPA03-11B]|uniref:hypothetical protein n=1 Tax=Bradyrhizobium sp. INPA03-11B TaxID=418598 RepID=UPI00338FB59E
MASGDLAGYEGAKDGVQRRKASFSFLRAEKLFRWLNVLRSGLAISNDSAQGCQHGRCSSADALIALGRDADIALRVAPRAIEILLAFGTITGDSDPVQARENRSILNLRIDQDHAGASL